jgi:hypothetical protein
MQYADKIQVCIAWRLSVVAVPCCARLLGWVLVQRSISQALLVLLPRPSVDPRTRKADGIPAGQLQLPHLERASEPFLWW